MHLNGLEEIINVGMTKPEIKWIFWHSVRGLQYGFEMQAQGRDQITRSLYTKDTKCESFCPINFIISLLHRKP